LMPSSSHLEALPRNPFLGAISFQKFREVLAAPNRYWSRTEKALIRELDGYLQFKQATLPAPFQLQPRPRMGR
jgi:hypothetical protein